jgi:hypothetical protein
LVTFARKVFENNMVLVMDVGLKRHIRQQAGLLFEFPNSSGNGHFRRDGFELIPAIKTAMCFYDKMQKFDYSYLLSDGLISALRL